MNNNNYWKQQNQMVRTHGVQGNNSGSNYCANFGKAKGKRYNNIGTGTMLGSSEEVQLLSRGQEQRANHLYSKIAENDTLTVKKDETPEFYF